MLLSFGSRLEQQHRMLAVRAQPVGEHASGRTGADDDVIEFGGFPRAIVIHELPRSTRDQRYQIKHPGKVAAQTDRGARSGPIEWEEVTGVPHGVNCKKVFFD